MTSQLDPVLKQRGITSILFALCVGALIFSGTYGILALLAIILLGVVFEMLALHVLPKWFIALCVIGAILISTAYCLLILRYPITCHMFSIIGILFNLILLGLMFLDYRNTLKELNKLSWWVYPSVGIGVFASQIYISNHPIKLVIILLLMIWICDSAAYLVGRKLGKSKLFERVSPKKTWEGAYGSLFFTILGALGFSFLYPENPKLFFIILGITVAVFGTLGDLLQSQIKRILNVKDSGNILPGHGGIWDRFDSFVFLLPFYCLLVEIFEI